MISWFRSTQWIRRREVTGSTWCSGSVQSTSRSEPTVWCLRSQASLSAFFRSPSQETWSAGSRSK